MIQVMRDQSDHGDLSPLTILFSLMTNLSQDKHEYTLTDQREPTRYAT